MAIYTLTEEFKKGEIKSYKYVIYDEFPRKANKPEGLNAKR